MGDAGVDLQRRRRLRVALLTVVAVTALAASVGFAWANLVSVPSLQAVAYGYSGPLPVGTAFQEDIFLNVQAGDSVALVSASARIAGPGVHVSLVAVRQAFDQPSPGGFLGDADLRRYRHVPIAGMRVVRLADQFPDMTKASWIVGRVVFDDPGNYRLPAVTISLQVEVADSNSHRAGPRTVHRQTSDSRLDHPARICRSRARRTALGAGNLGGLEYTDDYRRAHERALEIERVAMALAPTLVGLDEADAAERTKSSGCVMRVIARDGQGSFVRADRRFNRINVRVDRGRIVSAEVG